MFCTSNINPASKIMSMQVAATRAAVTNLSNSPKATNPTRRSRTVSQKMLIFLQGKCEKSAHRKPLAEAHSPGLRMVPFISPHDLVGMQSSIAILI